MRPQCGLVGRIAASWTAAEQDSVTLVVDLERAPVAYGKDFLAPDPPTVTRADLRVRFDVLGRFRLQAVEGPDAGKEFTFDASQPSRVLLGTSAACEAQLSDPMVSRRHAALELVGRSLRVTDLRSKNGTFVDGVSVVEANLRGGELVRVGSTALRVEEEKAERTELSERTSFGRMLGASPAMRRLYPLCERLAESDVPVVIEGETGTGKEQLAEALHELGPRKDEAFIVFDCTAVAPSLIESELFGHEKGAFTGATARHQGVFERANGGTLFIDEIGDLPLELQSKLLRAIERRVVTRVGGTDTIRVDVRVLAATRRDLDREVQENRFRDDLFHRIAVTRIELPPLRDRDGDVALLARSFARDMGADEAALPADLLERWADVHWPGNVRELRNAVARRLALGDLSEPAEGDAGGEEVALTNPLGGDAITRILHLDLPLTEARQRLIEAFESRYVEHVIEAHGGNVTRAAAAAGVGRRHLQRMRARAKQR